MRDLSMVCIWDPASEILPWTRANVDVFDRRAPWTRAPAGATYAPPRPGFPPPPLPADPREGPILLGGPYDAETVGAFDLIYGPVQRSRPRRSYPSEGRATSSWEVGDEDEDVPRMYGAWRDDLPVADAWPSYTGDGAPPLL